MVMGKNNKITTCGYLERAMEIKKRYYVIMKQMICLFANASSPDKVLYIY